MCTLILWLQTTIYSRLGITTTSNLRSTNSWVALHRHEIWTPRPFFIMWLQIIPTLNEMKSKSLSWKKNWSCTSVLIALYTSGSRRVTCPRQCQGRSSSCSYKLYSKTRLIQNACVNNITVASVSWLLYTRAGHGPRCAGLAHRRVTWPWMPMSRPLLIMWLQTIISTILYEIKSKS